MRVVVFITLLHLYACKEQSKPRSVNLALETVLEFDNNENSADIQIIDKVKSFLDRVRLFIDKSKPFRRNFDSDNRKFTDFVKNAMIIISEYSNDDLDDLLTVVDDEIRKYHYKGCKFYELIENYNVRRFMAGKLESVRNAPMKDIRSSLKNILKTMEDNNLDVRQKLLVDYVNSLYLEDSGPKFRKLLENLALYKAKSKRTNLDLVKIVREGLRSIFFDHYSGLDYKTRKELKMKLETYWKDYSNPDAVQHHVWHFKPFNKNKKSPSHKKETQNAHKDISFESLEVETTTRKLDIKKLKEKAYKLKKKMKAEFDDLGKRTTKSNYVQDSRPAIEADKESDTEVEIPISSKRPKLTFITLYPEAITFLKKRTVRTTKAIPFQTLWEEPIIYKNKHRKRHHAKKIAEQRKKIEKKEMEKLMIEQEEMKKIVAEESEKSKNDNAKRKRGHLKKIAAKKNNKILTEEDEILKTTTERMIKREHLKKPATEKTEMEKMMVEHDEIEREVKEGEMEDEQSEEAESTEEEGSVVVEGETVVRTTPEGMSRHKDRSKRTSKQQKLDPYFKDIDVVPRSRNHNKVRKSRKSYKANSELDTNEGLPIESNEATKPYRKSNKNDTFPTAHTKADINDRILELEKQLKDVKAQIVNKPDFVVIPTYDKLDFWQGTTKVAASTNATTKTTVVTTTKTTAKTTPTAVTKATTASVNSTYHPVFRSEGSANETKSISTPQIVKEEQDINLKNFTSLHMLDANNEVYNTSANIEDDLNDIGGSDILDTYKAVNITSHVDNLEKYLNSTKDNPGDKKHVVRKKMYEELKNILADTPEPENVTARVLSDKDTGKAIMKGDPLEFMDDAESLK